MDVCGMFSGDTSYYGAMRGSYYRDYEQFPYGTLENVNQPPAKDLYSKVQEKCQQAKEKSQKKHCPFCKEQKKRPLVNYLRKRQMRKHNDSICEEGEEVAEESDEQHHCGSDEETAKVVQ